MFLIEDCKLTVGPASSSISFGSKEDDRSALKSLSEVKLKEDHSIESLAAIIVKHLETVSEVNLLLLLLLLSFSLFLLLVTYLLSVVCCLCSLKF